MAIDKTHIAQQFQEMQDHICTAMTTLESDVDFQEDKWTRPEGGGGRTRILQQKKGVEKGGVNFSAVDGPLPKRIQQALKVDEVDFFATGVSIVMHPYNPMVPIIHMNVRYFELSNGTCWFGGGIDLTPHYVDKDQATWFHEKLKAVCDKYDPSYYPEFKQWADDYFFLPHRDETRGVGGIFFDRKSPNTEEEKQQLLDFTCDLCKCFAEVYPHLVTINVEKKFTQENEEWQQLRRSRYVEFNLLFDKGTKFGIDTGGRTESILMSMPPNASWKYDYSPVEGSAEAETIDLLKKGIDWVK